MLAAIPTEYVKDTPNSKPSGRFGFLYLLLAIWALALTYSMLHVGRNAETLYYSQFLSLLKEGKVESVLIGHDRIEGLLRKPDLGQSKSFSVARVEDPDLIRKLSSQNVKYTGVRDSGLFRGLLGWLLPFALLVGLWSLVAGRIGRASGSPFLSLGKSKARIYSEKGVKVRFNDVAGIDEVKLELQEVVSFLKDPPKYSRLGGRMPKGILLIGPPGTGKTMLARAVAGEARVPFFSINGSEFVELFVGLGAARVRDLFHQARSQAPCIVFIDELDALGKARGVAAISGSANDEKEQTLNQLLAEMDGFDASEGIVIVGATNRPEVLDPALSRAGRFDRQILVDKPDRKGRHAILDVHLKKIRTSPEVNSGVIASMTAGFSGADLANVVNEAALIATRRGAECVEPRDFTESIERVIAGLERRSRLLNLEEKTRVAYHEMGHVILGLVYGDDEVVHKVTIIPRGLSALGYTFRRPIEDRYLMTQNELIEKITVLMGGRAAEMLFFEEISTGSADDLDKATEIARAMVTRYGMSKSLGAVTFEQETAPVLGGQGFVRTAEYSQSTAEQIDYDVKHVLDKALSKAREVLEEHKEILEKGAKLLFDQETLDEQQLRSLWEQYAKAKQVA